MTTPDGLTSGVLSPRDGSGGVDLQSALESAQSFHWRRTDGRMYEDAVLHGGRDWYYTVRGDDVVFVRQRGDRLEWRATTDATDLLCRRLRLDDDLEAIFDGFPDDPHLDDARRAFPGLRVVRDPFFPCLVSFVCSARTPVGRIHALQVALARAFGDAVTVDGGTYFDGGTYYSFPRPAQLARATESDLRELGLGFRAPYVEETARMVASGELTPEDLRSVPYRSAHERLQSFPGVGPKVADCVSLFALGHLEAVPVDTWTRRLVERFYPAMADESYDATASAFRERFGDLAGYAQTYLYHFVRSRAGPS